MEYISIKNWARFQHYKDRTPPWIKLHRDLLRDYKFSCLQDASKLHLILLWLLASQMDNKIPNDPEWIKKQIGIKTNLDLKDLLNHGFILLASDTLAPCKQSDIVETETEAYKEEAYKEETETEILSGKKLPDDTVKKIITYLNKTAGTRFRFTGLKSREKIIARFNDGFSLQDFFVVIDKKTADWIDDPKMVKFLRPETLFGPRFGVYLGQRDRPMSNLEKGMANSHQAAIDLFGEKEAKEVMNGK